MPVMAGLLFDGVGRRHPVTLRSASLMDKTMRRMCALRDQRDAGRGMLPLTEVTQCVVGM